VLVIEWEHLSRVLGLEVLLYHLQPREELASKLLVVWMALRLLEMKWARDKERVMMCEF